MLEFILLFAAFYVWHACGITLGYHRGLSHRAYSCPKWVEYFWVLPGFLAFEGSPIWWSTMHRAHHHHVDTELDPHSPRYGVAYAHLGWLAKMSYPSHIDPNVQAKDLINDPIYAFLEQGGNWRKAHTLSYALNLLFRVAILAAFGWVPALASLLAGLAVQQIPLMLNVLCHLPKWGYKTYAGYDDSVNVWWVGLLAMGEGWHNNHHAAPGSARSGMAWWELDVSYMILVVMKKLGLVTRMNVVSHERMMEIASKYKPAVAPVAAPVVAPISVPELVPAMASVVAPATAAVSASISAASGKYSEVIESLETAVKNSKDLAVDISAKQKQKAVAYTISL
ncbi:fatty acid desaturase [bacterium]|jgi:fatty-acid desaturase|nr:fatty acid desaturase [bacterium]